LVRQIVGHRFDLDIGKWGKQPCAVLEVEPERLLMLSSARTADGETTSPYMTPGEMALRPRK